MTHDERVWHHLYVDSKSPLENAERIASLEELLLDIALSTKGLRKDLDDRIASLVYVDPLLPPIKIGRMEKS